MTLVRDQASGRAPGHAHRDYPRTLRWLAPRALAALAAVLIGAVAALAIVLALAGRLSPDGAYTVLGHPVMTVRSGSMPPVIRSGDLIVDDPVSRGQARHLRPGQLVSFRSAAGRRVIVTARVIARRVSGSQVSYLTVGGPGHPATRVLRPAGEVVGSFGFAVPGGADVVAVARNPIIPAVILAATVLWLAGGPLYRRVRRARSRRAAARVPAPVTPQPAAAQAAAPPPAGPGPAALLPAATHTVAPLPAATHTVAPLPAATHTVAPLPAATQAAATLPAADQAATTDPTSPLAVPVTAVPLPAPPAAPPPEIPPAPPGVPSRPVPAGQARPGVPRPGVPPARPVPVGQARLRPGRLRPAWPG